MNFYTGVFVCAATVVLVGSLTHFWMVMSGWGWRTSLKLLCVSGPALLNLVTLGNLASAELKTRRLKQQLIQSHAVVQREPPANANVPAMIETD
jgi:hypothetical protein